MKLFISILALALSSSSYAQQAATFADFAEAFKAGADADNIPRVQNCVETISTNQAFPHTIEISQDDSGPVFNASSDSTPKEIANSVIYQLASENRQLIFSYRKTSLGLVLKISSPKGAGNHALTAYAQCVSAAPRVVVTVGSGEVKIHDSTPPEWRAPRLETASEPTTEFRDNVGRSYEEKAGNQWLRSDGVMCSGTPNAMRCD